MLKKISKKSLRFAVQLALIASGLASLNACNNKLQFNAPPATTRESSVEVFKRTVYPIVSTHCSACHGGLQSPYFAHSDPQRAYDELTSTGKVNLGSPSQSRIVQRLALDLHNCWGTCPDDAAQMLSAVQTWAKEKPFTLPPLVMTEARLVPSSLTTAAVDLSFPLDAIQGTFMISVVKFDNYSYRFFNPRIKTTQPRSVFAKEIHVLLNQHDPPGATTFRKIERVFNSTATPTVLSTASLILEMEQGPGKDYVSIGFGSIGDGSGSALAAARFATAKQAIQTNCGSCHTTTQPPLFAGLATEAEYLAFRWNGNPIVIAGNSTGSRLYQLLAGSSPAMPPNASGATRASIADSIRTWIDQINTGSQSPPTQ